MQLSEQDIAALEAFLTDRETMTAKQIGEKYGVHHGSIANTLCVLRKLGLSIQIKEGGRPKGSHSFDTAVVDRLLAGGASGRQIADHIGVSHEAVYLYMRAAGKSRKRKTVAEILASEAA